MLGALEPMGLLAAGAFTLDLEGANCREERIKTHDR
jgi:hypothetical protein